MYKGILKGVIELPGEQRELGRGNGVTWCTKGTGKGYWSYLVYKGNLKGALELPGVQKELGRVTRVTWYIKGTLKGYWSNLMFCAEPPSEQLFLHRRELNTHWECLSEHLSTLDDLPVQSSVPVLNQQLFSLTPWE